jgi:hypothetical protein
MPDDKLLPRNRTARLAAARAAGNPVTTELESGVGNCFPGLELDARNLDRRFFPYLTVDFGIPRQTDGRLVGDIVVAEVDLARAEGDGAPEEFLAGLREVAATPTGWRISRIAGDFVGYGQREFIVEDLGTTPETPVDDWTAVRLLRPASEVSITLVNPDGHELALTARRASYLRDDGAFAAMFEPGELTQSLCSPWTHDFRDCGCFYWASNHPDIVQPAVPSPAAADDPDYAVWVSWLRADRLTNPPPPDPRHRGELRHHEINHRWQELDVVLDGREQRVAYAPDIVPGVALADEKLISTLRYAAGVELAVMLEYLAAAYSLNLGAGQVNSALRQDVAVAHYEIMRVAQSEMRHLKAINGLLLDEHQRHGVGAFLPALGVATEVPAAGGATVDSMNFRPLTPEVLDDFVEVEAPSMSVDALYGRILATYQRDGKDTQAATVIQVMAEGADHYSTFVVVRELLGRHGPAAYLLDPLEVPDPGDEALNELQERFETMLGHFFAGYAVGLPDGRSAIEAGRALMLGDDGVEGACKDLAARGILPVFDHPSDPRFPAVDPPPP